MTLSELRDTISRTIDHHPHTAALPVVMREVGHDAAQEPTGEVTVEVEDGVAFAVLSTREP